MIYAKLEQWNDTIILMNEIGEIIIIELQNLQTIFIFKTFTEQKYFTDFIYLENFQQICACTNNGYFYLYSIIKLDKNQEQIEKKKIDLGPITLNNLQLFKQIELEKLEFIAYSPPYDMKQFVMKEKGGTYIVWSVPKDFINKGKYIIYKSIKNNIIGELKFELEFPLNQMLDRIDINLGFLEIPQTEFSLDNKFGITITYIDPETNKWLTLIEKFDISALLNNSMEIIDNNPFSYQQNLHLRSITLHTPINTRYMTLILHHLYPLNLQTNKSSIKNILLNIGTIGLCVYGIKRNKENFQYLQREKRRELFLNKNFHISILEACQQPSTSTDLRILCLELLWLIWTATNEMSHIIQSINLKNFIDINIIYSGIKNFLKRNNDF